LYPPFVVSDEHRDHPGAWWDGRTGHPVLLHNLDVGCAELLAAFALHAVLGLESFPEIIPTHTCVWVVDPDTRLNLDLECMFDFWARRI